MALPIHGFDVYTNDEPGDPNPGVMLDASGYTGKALTPTQARDLAGDLESMADHLDSASAEMMEHCAACGEIVEECHGHGEIGDPVGYAVRIAHDEDDHSRCRIIAGCALLTDDGDLSSAYYLGPLTPALTLLDDEGMEIGYEYRPPSFSGNGWVHRVTFLSTGYEVNLPHGVTLAPLMEDNWGTSVTSADEALRYALGSLIGPIDAEYNEDALRETLIERGA